MKICLVVPHAFPLFDATSTSVFGGSEVRAWTFGTALANLPDYRISFLVSEPGPERRAVYGKTEVYTYASTPPKSSMVKRMTRAILGFRPMNPLQEHLYRLQADIYCGFGASDFTAALGDCCKALGGRFVLFCGSDSDFWPIHLQHSAIRNAYGVSGEGAWKAMSNADLVITQTRHQSGLLLQRFGKSGSRIANAIDLKNKRPGPGDPTMASYVLWIGKADNTKRPGLVLELARSMADLPFVMVMNRSVPKVWESVVQQLPANVRLLEKIPFSESDKLFEGALVLLNTSEFEGFPNTFLQAGKYGVPVLSLSVDPDEFITQTGCGLVCQNDTTLLQRSLRRLREDRALWQECSKAMTRYVVENHELTACVQELDAALNQVMQR